MSNQLYMLTGKDAFRRSEALKKIRQELDTDGNLANNTVRFDPAESKALTPAGLQSACQSGSFFAVGRLVIIEGLQARFSGAGRRGRRSATGPLPDFDAFTGVLAELPDSTTVVLLDEASGDFLNSLKDHAEVMQFSELKGKDLRDWAQQRTKQSGAAFAPAAIERLLTMVDGAHLHDLANEIDKLGTYAMGRTVTVADVDTMTTTAAMETMPWHILDPIIEGRAGRAIKAIQEAGDKDWHPMVVMAMTRNALRRLLLVQSMLREGVPAEEIGSRVGLKGFPLQKAIENSGRFPADRLEAAYRLMLRADVDVKTGVMPIETVLPALIVELAELQRSQRGLPAVQAAYRSV